MKDPRVDALADILVTHSTRLAPGERVLIETFDVPPEFTALLVRRVAACGALPLVSVKQGQVLRALYTGVPFERVRLDFEGGRIVRATADKAERLNAILDTDEGARFLGEFSLTFHPGILHPLGDALFDEKIAVSLHLTPGNAYEEADNGNRSAVHWDMVLIQRPEYGGGEIFFDGELVRQDGRFVVPDLEGLNPERRAP